MARTIMLCCWICFPAIAAVILFVSAGRMDLPMVWGVLGILAFFSLLLFTRTDPALLRERMRPGPGNRDRVTRPVTLVLFLSHWILTGLDIGRFQWSPVPWTLQLFGLVGYAVSMAGVIWIMRVNPFYSSVVRVQTDRGHRTITTGPYRLVRHPGYAATLLGMTCGGLALGSWVGMLPLVGVLALFIRRTLLEDRMLQRELAGYAEYAGRVRYRLVAGVF